MSSSRITAPEQRTIDVDVSELDTRGRTVHGYAAVYGVESEDLGGFTERIAPGAFAGVLDADVRALLNHDANEVLGRTKSGTLRLADEDRGLRFELDLPTSPLGDNVREAIRRGDLDGASFRFTVGDEEWSDDLRTIKTVTDLRDITLATYPAYPQASVELRTRPETANDNGAERQEKDTMSDDEKTGTAVVEPADEERSESTSTGTLTVESRTETGAERPVEDRVREEMLSVRKGETRALSTTSASAVAPAELSSFVYDKLRAESVALRSGIAVVNTERTSVQWPRITADVDPGWYAEAATITPGDPTIATLTATPRKLAHLVQFSNEIVDDSEPSAIDVVRDNLVRALGLKLDFGIFEGTGTAPQIRGLKNVSGIQTVSAGTNGAAPTLDMFADAIALLESVNAPRPYAIVAPARTFSTLRKSKATTNEYLLTGSPGTDAPASVFGVPFYVSNQLTLTETQGSSSAANSAYVFATSQVVLVRRQDITVELDRSRLFNSDQSELRGKLRADLVAPNPTAIVRVVGLL